jgi:hypothetical protein
MIKLNEENKKDGFNKNCLLGKTFTGGGISYTDTTE